MGVDGYLDLAEHHVENDAGGLAPDPGQRLERGAVGRQLTAVPFKQLPAESDEVVGLGVVQAYAPDVGLQALDAQREDRGGRVGNGEEVAGRCIDALVGGVSREHDGDQQLER